MADKTLSNYLDKYFDWRLSSLEARYAVDGSELATDLVRAGYCVEPYLGYAQALACPINKCGEEYCSSTHCESHDFCMLLRREGYVCKK